MHRSKYSLSDIETAVCGFYKLDLHALQTRNRTRAVAYPRFIAIHLARQLTPHSLPRLGERYHRDHTSILHGQRRALELIGADEKFAAGVDAVREILDNSPRRKERRWQEVHPQQRQPRIDASLASTWI